MVLTIDIPTFEHSDRFETMLPRAGVPYELHPPLDWNAPQLISLTAPTPARIEFSMQRDGHDAGKRDDDVIIHPLNEALYFVRDGADTVDLSWIFAAYVNERDAVVDNVITSAQASGVVDSFDWLRQHRSRQCLSTGVGGVARAQHARHSLFERRSGDRTRTESFLAANVCVFCAKRGTIDRQTVSTAAC